MHCITARISYLACINYIKSNFAECNPVLKSSTSNVKITREFLTRFYRTGGKVPLVNQNFFSWRFLPFFFTLAVYLVCFSSVYSKIRYIDAQPNCLHYISREPLKSSRENSYLSVVRRTLFFLPTPVVPVLALSHLI